MDVASVKDLLANLIAASSDLGVNQKKIPIWQAMLERMPPYMISSEGVVKEWLTAKIDDNLDHRHSSQLYPLYYRMPDEIGSDPILKDAFRKIVEIKLKNHYQKAGFMSFGLVQLGQAAATLGDGELAFQSIVRLVNSYWLSNLASMHNPKSLFNMDVSGGLPAVLIQMLINSAPGRIQLLPALPKSWPEGTLQGALCRGQVEAKRLSWKPGRVEVTLVSKKDQTVEVFAPGSIKSFNSSNTRARVIYGSSGHSRKVFLPAAKPVSIEITMK